MALIDTRTGALTIRIVYDGSPQAGKTTSLQSLARKLAVPFHSPGEYLGRTLYFDWVDYVGGLYDGRRIRCQLVSVPGQEVFGHRRKLLVQTADAIVFVGDSRRGSIKHSIDITGPLIPWASSRTPPIGVIFQANKRDSADAVSRGELERALLEQGAGRIALVESVATDGEGIREAFVLAVRLALDRVRALDTDGLLQADVPDEDSPSDLLKRLIVAEPLLTEPGSRLSADLVAENQMAAPASVTAMFAEDDEQPFAPDPAIPGGLIWPPVEGRMLLHDAARLPARPQRTARGDWCGSAAGWRYHSAATAVFSDLSAARQALIEWARLHSVSQRVTTEGRAIVLAEAGEGRYRLWQVVRTERPLAETLAVEGRQDTDTMATRLELSAYHLMAARERFRATGVELPCQLWTISTDRYGGARYCGLMPTHPLRDAEPEGDALVRRELTPRLNQLRDEEYDLDALASQLRDPRHSSREVATLVLRLVVDVRKSPVSTAG